MSTGIGTLKFRTWLIIEVNAFVILDINILVSIWILVVWKFSGVITIL